MKKQTSSFLNTTNLEILRCLLLSDRPVALREISYRTLLQVRSVQIILAKLLKQKVVRKKKDGQRTLYSLNKLDLSLDLIKSFLDNQTILDLKIASNRYSEKAPYVLKTLTDMHLMITTAKDNYGAK